MKAIVVVARGLQLGALGCYGNQWIDTPALDALAAAGVVFDQHFADNADPLGARRAWRSGRYHLPTPSPAAESGSERDLLAALRERRIHTCLIVDDSRPSPDEFALGWDEVERIVPAEDESPLEATLEAAGAILERLEHRDDWLLWIDFGTLLSPWDVPEEFQTPYFHEEPLEEEDEEEEAPELEPLTPLAEMPVGAIDPDDDTLFLSLHASYAAAVSYLDSGIGALLQALDGLEGGSDMLLLFTSDVGPNLGEHGMIGPVHARLHDEVIHLPLLVRLPGGAEAGRHVSALTQAVDLAATLADYFQEPLPDAHGRSLLPLARGEVEAIRSYACAGRQTGAEIEYALRTPEWAFLLPVLPSGDDSPHAPQLYVKPDDRSEVNNVLQHHLDLAEQYEQTLRDFVTVSCQPGPLQTPLLRGGEDAPDDSPRTRAFDAKPVSE
jgi:arylsulfatase A-like enzyme